MEKKLIFLILLFAIGRLNGQDYYVIDFVGEGAILENIIVKNLTQGTNLEMAGTDVLHIMLEPTVINEIKIESKKLRIFPNPTEQTCNLEFYNSKSGNVSVNLFSITGKQILNFSSILSKGNHTFNLSGIAAGSYLINVKSEFDLYTGILVSLNQTESSISLTHNGEMYQNESMDDAHSSESLLLMTNKDRDTKVIIEMDYHIGDELKFIGITSGFQHEIIFDSPSSDQTYTFLFDLYFGQSCQGLSEFTDIRDGNVYSTVQIGNQCWMAKNLAYLPEITFEDNWHSLTEKQYAVTGYEPGSGSETIAGAIASEHYGTYGALYNWAAVMDGAAGSDEKPSGVQGVCPQGWHVPSNSEWSELGDFLDAPLISVWGSVTGNYLKSCRQIDSPLEGECDTFEHPRWDSNDTYFGTDMYGFAAIPGGVRINQATDEAFSGFGSVSVWWSATEITSDWANSRDLRFNSGKLEQHDWWIPKVCGFSVRCLKD